MIMVFKLSPDSDIGGTSLKGLVYASYPELKKLYGEALEGDDYKVSGQWVFEDDDGNIFTLYDYKATDFYDPELESVKQFRNNKSPTEFHVGGRTSAVNFMNWLGYELAKLRSNAVVIDEFNTHVKVGLGS